ncbi:2-thiouracil desulfurase family protein [Serratia sp. UGAL515B_01]|uniref:YbgA family protein n=1 Tax=Serratia sp. UGAL515B_01 TaxID=2986763 RepID=UPI002954181A|nr:2-thiouracil desulfurase family protein [Serratia sp. UGAL515B_01]WON76073.1 2-thiouracil desulfurase family protein [Serratia sp. UGAL515B_01]
MSDKITIGISACLLGSSVRFDGGHKRCEFAVEQLAPYVQFEPICPEMAIGLPTPRPALRLIKSGQQTLLCNSSDRNVDLTDKMQQFSEQRVSSLQHLCGYIVCAKSPSCGMERVKVYDENGAGSRKSGVGLFTAELMRQFPWLPVEEDGRLNDPVLRENFVERVFALYELNTLWHKGLTRGGLIAFHSRYKLLLLAHSQPEYRELGRFVAGIEKWDSLDAFAVEYRQRLMTLLAHKATRRNHTNVLMHVQGYFRNQLSGAQRQELAQLIERYRQGVQPLLAPITLLKHYMAEYPDSYLAQQRYFEPYPEALRLRYGH